MGKLHLKKMKKDAILISDSNDPVITWLSCNNFSKFFANLAKACYQYLSLSFLFTYTNSWAIKLISCKLDCSGLLCKYLHRQRTREAHLLIINIPLYVIKPCLFQCTSWKQERSMPKLQGLSIFHICVAQPAPALTVCQAENPTPWNPSCSQLCCPGTQVWTEFGLKRARNYSEPSARVVHGKTQLPPLQQTQPDKLQPWNNRNYKQARAHCVIRAIPLLRQK